MFAQTAQLEHFSTHWGTSLHHLFDDVGAQVGRPLRGGFVDGFSDLLAPYGLIRLRVLLEQNHPHHLPQNLLKLLRSSAPDQFWTMDLTTPSHVWMMNMWTARSTMGGHLNEEGK